MLLCGAGVGDDAGGEWHQRGLQEHDQVECVLHYW